MNGICVSELFGKVRKHRLKHGAVHRCRRIEIEVNAHVYRPWSIQHNGTMKGGQGRTHEAGPMSLIKTSAESYLYRLTEQGSYVAVLNHRSYIDSLARLR